MSKAKPKPKPYVPSPPMRAGITYQVYKVGDGDTKQHMRAGSCHKHLKSLMTGGTPGGHG